MFSPSARRPLVPRLMSSNAQLGFGSTKWWRTDASHNLINGLISRRIQQPWTMRYHGEESEPSRAQRLEAIRRQIAEGTYDTPERLAAAVSDLFDREFGSNRADDLDSLGELN